MKDNNIFGSIGPGSIFNLLMLLVSVGGLLYLLIWSFQSENNSLIGLAMGLIFLLFIVSGLIFSRLEFLKLGNWSQNAWSFTLGFFIWIVLGNVAGTQSVLSLTGQNQFATLTSQLPQLLNVIMTGFVIPIAEEMFWIVGIPFVVIWISQILSKRYSIFAKKPFQLFLMVLIAGTTFAAFHVGKFFLYFLIAAFLFRSVMILSIYGQPSGGFFKGLKSHPIFVLLPAFSIGAHIANNLSNLGFGTSISILNANFLPLGLLIYIFFGSIFFTVIYDIYAIFAKKKSFNEVVD